MTGRFVLKASGDEFVFNLKAGNNEIILTSERYTAKASALGGIEAATSLSADDDGIAAVKAAAPEAKLEGSTQR